MRLGAARVTLERFGEEVFGSRLVLWNRGAPSIKYIGGKNNGDAGSRIDRAWIDCERPLEEPQTLLPGRRRIGSHARSPPAHDEIAGIGIGRLFLLDATPGRLDQLEAKSAGEPPGDLALRFREVAAIGLEPT